MERFDGCVDGVVGPAAVACRTVMSYQQQNLDLIFMPFLF
jgi:hypothetical protein